MEKNKEIIKEIEEAKSIFGIKNKISSDILKKKYRNLARKTHPDRVAGKEEEFKKISRAYKLLAVYISQHGPSLRSEDIRKNCLGREFYEHLMRFYDGWWDSINF